MGQQQTWWLRVHPCQPTAVLPPRPPTSAHGTTPWAVELTVVTAATDCVTAASAAKAMPWSSLIDAHPLQTRATYSAPRGSAEGDAPPRCSEPAPLLRSSPPPTTPPLCSLPPAPGLLPPSPPSVSPPPPPFPSSSTVTPVSPLTAAALAPEAVTGASEQTPVRTRDGTRGSVGGEDRCRPRGDGGGEKAGEPCSLAPPPPPNAKVRSRVAMVAIAPPRLCPVTSSLCGLRHKQAHVHNQHHSQPASSADTVVEGGANAQGMGDQEASSSHDPLCAG
jgi:hypothetical protein